MVRTRLIRYRDGRQEIVRLISTDDSTDWRAAGPLGYERSIVWLEDIRKLPFVRVVEVRCARSRRGRLLLQGTERVVGYAKLVSDAPRDSRTGRFTRRLFYLKAGDERCGTIPEKGLDPQTILPGVAGVPPLPEQDVEASLAKRGARLLDRSSTPRK